MPDRKEPDRLQYEMCETDEQDRARENLRHGEWVQNIYNCFDRGAGFTPTAIRRFKALRWGIR